MRSKAEQNKQKPPSTKTEDEIQTAHEESEKVVNELLKEYEKNIFRSGEKAERSKKNNKKSKGKKHK